MTMHSESQTILRAHYARAEAAWERGLALAADDAGALAAADTAGLWVMLDALESMARVEVARAGYASAYPPIQRRPAQAVAAPLVAILARHSQRVHDARTFLGDRSASLEATTTALVSVLR